MRKADLLPFVGCRVRVVTDEYRGKHVYVCTLSVVRNNEVFLRGDFFYRKNYGGGIWVKQNEIEAIFLEDEQEVLD